ncbi:uncharacterized protein LOC141651830 [Silene latifolia]|uniref:uncharacterized protein LOC141651830 n=1 Tax=Silene latifolia TaxID=37657 RepID=UPI003D77CDBB
MLIPLLDKIRNKIYHWANSLLSYAGKISLINSVIFGIQNFWGASVLLPKGIAKRIHRMCKNFLWGIADGTRSAYILKGADFWTFKPTAAHSWFWHNIILYRDELLKHTGGIAAAKTLMGAKDYKDQISELLRPKGPKISMFRTLGDSSIYPKHGVIGLLAAQNKFPTVDNLCIRGLVLVNRCSLCECQAETADHLFFECPYSAEVWDSIASWLKIPCLTNLAQTLTWFSNHNRGRSWVKKQRRCALLSVIYLLWSERNKRIFKEARAATVNIIRRVKYLVCIRTRPNIEE